MTQGNAAATGLPARLLIGPIRGYQRWLSPALPARCRFLPTCSEYAVEALRRRGVLVGSALALWRLVRCQPFHPGGYDPVPRPQPVRRPHRKHDASVQWATPPSGVIR